MLEPLLQFFEKLVLEFSWRRLFLVFVIGAFALCAFTTFEWYTSYFRLGRLEKTTQLLKELRSLRSDATISNEDDLQRVYKIISAQLEETSAPRSINLSSRSQFAKFLGGSILWLLFGFAYVTRVEGKNRAAGFVFALTVGVIVGLVGIFLPEFMWPWFNYLVYPILNFFLIFSFVTMLARSIRS